MQKLWQSTFDILYIFIIIIVPQPMQKTPKKYVQPIVLIGQDRLMPIVESSSTGQQLITLILSASYIQQTDTLCQYQLIRQDNGEILQKEGTLEEQRIQTRTVFILEAKWSLVLNTSSIQPMSVHHDFSQHQSQQETVQEPLGRGIMQQQNLSPTTSIQVQILLSVEQNNDQFNRLTVDHLHQKILEKINLTQLQLSKSPQGQPLDNYTKLQDLINQDTITIFCNMPLSQLKDFNPNSSFQQSQLSSIIYLGPQFNERNLFVSDVPDEPAPHVVYSARTNGSNTDPPQQIQQFAQP